MPRWTLSGAVAVFVARFMCHSLPMRSFLTLAILACLASAPAVKAEEAPDAPSTPAIKPKKPSVLRAEELDKLFGQLHADDAERAAAGVQQKIWANWNRSDSITAELLLGQAKRAMGAQEFPVAEEILDRLILARPEFSEAWNVRATLHFKALRFEKSLADIDKVLELEPRHFGALAGRGMIYEAQDKPDEALNAFREALSVNPHMVSVKEKVKQLEKLRPDI